MPSEVFTLAQTPITAHAFNGDRKGWFFLDMAGVFPDAML
jgi:hypothetical protein